MIYEITLWPSIALGEHGPELIEPAIKHQVCGYDIVSTLEKFIVKDKAGRIVFYAPGEAVRSCIALQKNLMKFQLKFINYLTNNLNASAVHQKTQDRTYHQND